MTIIFHSPFFNRFIYSLQHLFTGGFSSTYLPAASAALIYLAASATFTHPDGFSCSRTHASA